MTDEVSNVDEQETQNEGGFWRRMRKGLGRTREGFGKSMADLLVGAKEIDDEIFDEIETQLLVADVHGQRRTIYVKLP